MEFTCFVYFVFEALLSDRFDYLARLSYCRLEKIAVVFDVHDIKIYV